MKNKHKILLGMGIFGLSGCMMLLSIFYQIKYIGAILIIINFGGLSLFFSAVADKLTDKDIKGIKNQK